MRDWRRVSAAWNGRVAIGIIALAPLAVLLPINESAAALPDSGAAIDAFSRGFAPSRETTAEPVLGEKDGVGPVSPSETPMPSNSQGPYVAPNGRGPLETRTLVPRADLIRPSPAVPSESAFSAPSPAPAASFLATEYTGWIPPDTDGAVGPNHLVTAVNGGFVIQNRSGAVLLSQTLEGFWTGYWDAGSTCEKPFDPRVLYDAQVDRWIVVSIRGRSTCVNRSAMLVAASTSGDPTGSWYKVALDADSTDTLWADYPTLGFSQNHVVIGANMFLGSSFERSQLWVLERPLSATSPKFVFSSLDSAKYGFTLMPATTLDPGVTTTYLASQWNPGSGTIALYRLTGALGSVPAISDGPIAHPQTTPWSWSAPSANFAPQLGTADRINNGDARMHGLVLRNGQLWATHNVFLPAGTPNRTSIQWWNLQTNGTVIQQGLIDDPTGTTFRAYPSISVNVTNDVLIGYSSFSANQYASANYSLRLASDPLGTFGASALLKAGEGPYVAYDSVSWNRWGDYSSTHVDPVDDTQFWTQQEFARPPAGGSGRWATWWGQISPAPTGPPVNDDFVDAIALGGGSGSVSGTNVGATGETGEPLGSCSAGDTEVNSVWWSWTPTTTDSVQIDTNGSAFDTTLAVFTGSTFPTLVEVGCDDDGGDGLQSLLTLGLTAGVTYQIRVDGYSAATGAITLNYQQAGANLAPVVSAGSNQTVTLPSSAALDGTVSDDGLPSGSLTSTWTKQSGPGTVTFADTHAVDTTAGFSTNGVYVLRLSATDGALTTSDDVTITVNPTPNVAPVVSAGSNQTVTLPSSAALDGTVSDDGLPSGSLTSTWTKQSGPGTVTFADTHAVDTTAGFSTNGVYVLRLSATDGALTTSDDVTITVNPTPNVAPVVSAGSNQTVTLPSSAALDGTVSDDGLPTGSLTSTWTKQSGPGTVTFADTHAVDTTAGFSTNGVYVLRLSADDGALTTSDDVTITVNPTPNVAPVVSAGSNQTVTLPSSAALDGTVSDDGLPSGSLTSTWTKQSGPGTVTFADTHAVDTTAGFSTNGVYVLRLSATDGALTTSDDVTITVNPTPNVAPVVSAGSNQTVTLPSSAALDGTVSDDGLPTGSLTSTWTKQSGPGTVTFADTHAVDTTAGFSTNGVYVLRLSADDGALTTSDDVTITVNPMPPPPDFFIDDDDSVFEADINWMAAVGITMGCNPPPNNRFCPDSNVTRGQMAAFLVRALNLTDRLNNPFVDDDDSVFEADIERLAAAGITRGCNPPANDRFCPDAKVTRAQMAAFLVRALGYTDNGGGDLFVDDDDSIFEADIDRLGTAGVTKGCNPPTNDRFCPNDFVTRGQMAAFLNRALG